ncbi:MAG: hypothetical protein JNK20_16140 [Flavipsychrobacter sp.]|nr:hypothetical protein [Flavipsychrobacter sp.]
MKIFLLIVAFTACLVACSNGSDSSGTTVDSTAIEAAADSAAMVAKDAAKAIDSTVKAALDSTVTDSLPK